jgi:hypothetical protein
MQCKYLVYSNLNIRAIFILPDAKRENRAADSQVTGLAKADFIKVSHTRMSQG